MLKKSNVKRLASLSALGAGALGGMTGTGEASNIVYSGIVDERVGFSRGFKPTATLAGPNGIDALFATHIYLGSSGATVRHVKLLSMAGGFGTQFRFIAGTPSGSRRDFGHGFAAGAEWASAVNHRLSVSKGNIATVFNAVASGSYTTFNSTNRYLLFEFTGGKLSQTDYGWAQLTVSLRGPDVTLVDYAYDTSGAPIPAGNTGTPEPSTLVLTGLAALALGAKGLRAWRTARRPAKVTSSSVDILGAWGHVPHDDRAGRNPPSALRRPSAAR